MRTEDGKVRGRRGCLRRSGVGCLGLVAVVAVAFAVVSLGGGDGGDGDAGSQPDRCEAVAQAVVAAMAEGLTVEGGGSLRNAMAVRSGDFEKVWFLAADLQGPGLESSQDIAVWATNDIVGLGSVFSVDEVAKEFSQWGDGGRTDADLTMDDDGAEEAAQCARGAA